MQILLFLPNLEQKHLVSLPQMVAIRVITIPNDWTRKEYRKRGFQLFDDFAVNALKLISSGRSANDGSCPMFAIDYFNGDGQHASQRPSALDSQPIYYMATKVINDDGCTTLVPVRTGRKEIRRMRPDLKFFGYCSGDVEWEGQI